MKKHSLYYSAYCYFCQLVMFELRGKAHDVALCNISKGSHHSDLISGGGKGQVPCLKIQEGDDVSWLYESQDIIDYLKKHQLV